MRASQGAKIWSGKCRDAQWRAKTVLPGGWKLVMDKLAAFLNDIGDDGMCQLVMATAQWRLVCLMSGNRLGLALCHYFYYFFCFLHFFAAVCFFGGTTLLCGACFSLSLSVVSHVGYRRDWLEAGGEKYFSSLFRASLQLYIFARRGIRCFRLIFAVLDVFGWLFAWSQCARETRRNQTSIVFVATTMSSVV